MAGDYETVLKTLVSINFRTTSIQLLDDYSFFRSLLRKMKDGDARQFLTVFVLILFCNGAVYMITNEVLQYNIHPNVHVSLEHLFTNRQLQKM